MTQLDAPPPRGDPPPRRPRFDRAPLPAPPPPASGAAYRAAATADLAADVVAQLRDLVAQVTREPTTAARRVRAHRYGDDRVTVLLDLGAAQAVLAQFHRYRTELRARNRAHGASAATIGHLRGDVARCRLRATACDARAARAELDLDAARREVARLRAALRGAGPLAGEGL